jgi:hypothetical protein
MDTATASRGDLFNVSLTDQSLTFPGNAIAGKYTKTGIFRVEAVNADNTRKARLMLPVSGPEVGESSTINDLRSSTGAHLMMVKGKFTFTGKDTLTVSAEIELPGNLSLVESHSFAVGISNISDSGTLDKRGKVIGFTNARFKRVQVKLPKVDRKTHLTKGGEKLRITLTMLGSDFSGAGFDTEGISRNPLIPRAQPQARSLQFATVSGVSYYDQLPVNFIIAPRGSGEFGSIQQRN